MSVRRRSMTSTSLSPSRELINGWDTSTEVYARELQQRCITLEKFNKQNVISLQRKQKYLHYIVCFIGVLVGSMGVANTIYHNDPPIGIKIAQLILGYMISGASYIMSNSDINKKIEDSTKAYTLCIYSKNALGLTTHIPRDSRPNAASFLKKIVSDLEYIEGLCIYPQEPQTVIQYETEI